MAQRPANREGLIKVAIVVGSIATLLRLGTIDNPKFPVVMRQEDMPKLVDGPPARVIQDVLAFAIVVGAAAVARRL